MKKLFGFTLSEVLITLGIMGIIASLTIPALMADVKKHTYVHQLKKSYFGLQEGFKMMMAREQVDNINDTAYGDALSSYQFTSDDFFNAILPIFKENFSISKGYSATEYKALNPKTGNITTAKTCTDNVGKNYGLSYKVNNYSACVGEQNAILFLMKDGSYFVLENYGSNGILNEIVVDVNGLKKPNMYGYDVFSFMLLEDGSVIPAGSEEYARLVAGDNWKTRYWSTGSGYTCAQKGKQYTGYGSGCAASIIENNWEIKY